jgi:hypothetical protein
MIESHERMFAVQRLAILDAMIAAFERRTEVSPM